METIVMNNQSKTNKISNILFIVSALLLSLQFLWMIRLAINTHSFHYLMLAICTIGVIVSLVSLLCKRFGGFSGAVTFTLAYFIVFLFKSSIANSIHIGFHSIGYIIPWTCIIIGLCIKTKNVSTFQHLFNKAKEDNPYINVNYIMRNSIFLILYFVFLCVYINSPKRGFAPIAGIRLDAPVWHIKGKLWWDGFKKTEGVTSYSITQHSANKLVNDYKISWVTLIDLDGLALTSFSLYRADDELYAKIKHDIENKYGKYYIDVDYEKNSIIEIWNVIDYQGNVFAQIELHSTRINSQYTYPVSLLDRPIKSIEIDVRIVPYINKKYL